MNSWIAGLVGFVVAGVVIMLIARLGIQIQERSVSATQQRAVRTSEVDLMGMIEFDFQNIGSNHPSYELAPDSAIVGLDTSATPRVFEYWGQTQRGMPPDFVSYTWSTTGTKAIKRGTVDIYQVERRINGQLAGSSTGSITRFSIVLLDSDGNLAAFKEDARQIQVSISMVSNLGESSLLGETHWESIIRPTALARMDYEKYL